MNYYNYRNFLYNIIYYFQLRLFNDATLMIRILTHVLTKQLLMLFKGQVRRVSIVNRVFHHQLVFLKQILFFMKYIVMFNTLTFLFHFIEKKLGRYLIRCVQWSPNLSVSNRSPHSRYIFAKAKQKMIAFQYSPDDLILAYCHDQGGAT